SRASEELVAALQTELRQDVADMGLDRRQLHDQLVRDLGVGEALQHEAQDLAFALGQTRALDGLLHAVRLGPGLGAEQPRTSAFDRRADRVEQAGGVLAFVHEAVRAGQERRRCVLRRVVRRVDQYAWSRA